MAADLDAVIFVYVREARLYHPAETAPGDLQYRALRHTYQIQLVVFAIRYQKRSILLVDLEHLTLRREVLACGLSFRRGHRERQSERDACDQRYGISCDSVHCRNLLCYNLIGLHR